MSLSRGAAFARGAVHRLHGPAAATDAMSITIDPMRGLAVTEHTSRLTSLAARRPRPASAR